MSQHKAYGQQTVWDEALRVVSQKGRRKTRFLFELTDWFDFEVFRPFLETEFRPHKLGQSSYDPLLLFKVVMLQKWYGLSDPGVEELIYDRLSFRDFLGLGLHDPIPDETTICNFRNRLVKSGLYERLFALLKQQLTERGVLVKGGSIVDATFVEAPKGKRQDGSKVCQGADFGHKGHGQSVHVNGNFDKLIVNLEVTSARPHDSQHIGDVLTGEESVLYADSAYGAKEYRAVLAEVGIEDQIIEKASAHHPLTEEQKARNREKSRVRSRGEHIFATWKTVQGFVRVRYDNLWSNRADAFFHATAYNLRRGLFLSKNGLYQRPCTV